MASRCASCRPSSLRAWITLSSPTTRTAAPCNSTGRWSRWAGTESRDPRASGVRWCPARGPRCSKRTATALRASRCWAPGPEERNERRLESGGSTRTGERRAAQARGSGGCDMRRGHLALLISAALSLPCGAPARAAESFAGQTIDIASSTAPGGGFDLYVRLLARHIGAHLGGHPTIVPQNRPGGGGLVLANYLYNAAPKDGTQIGMIPAYVLLEQRFKNPQAKFDPDKFVWVGNMNREVD